MCWCVVACVDIDPFSTDVTVEDVPGEYEASFGGETRLLSFNRDGSYLLKANTGSFTDSFLGSWKARANRKNVELSLECADDPRTDPFSEKGEPASFRDLQHSLAKTLAATSQLPNGSIVRGAVAQKSFFGTITIAESFDGGGVVYSKK